MPRVIPRLHLVSDSRVCGLDCFSAVALAAIAAGADAVHLREKTTPAATLLSMATALREQFGDRARLFINDRIDVALASRAGGIQLGETSIPVAVARVLAGPDLMIGRSVHDVEGARRAAADGADFVIAGHVFETASKHGEKGRGLQFIEMVVAGCPLPVIAIGGITPERAPEVIRAGAYGVAVISGILAAPDPARAARRYAEALESSG